MKAGHTEEYVDGTSAAPWPQLDGVRPKTSPSLVDDGRSEDGEGRGDAKYNSCNVGFGDYALYKSPFYLLTYLLPAPMT